MTRSRILVGTVAHRRSRPRPNAFRYRVWHLLVDVDELDTLDASVRGFGHRRPNVVRVRPQDHLGSADGTLRGKLAAWLADRGATLPPGPLLLVTYPRVLGHVFNPVSWWFAHDEEGVLQFVVAEVHNTFGDWHAYLLDDLVAVGPTVRTTATKNFHVSPFLPTSGLDYRFVFRPPGDRLLAHVEVCDAEGHRVLVATQDQRAIPLTTRSLVRVLVRYPLVTLRTVALIHLQALRLWRRGTPFHRRPEVSA